MRAVVPNTDGRGSVMLWHERPPPTEQMMHSPLFMISLLCWPDQGLGRSPTFWHESLAAGPTASGRLAIAAFIVVESHANLWSFVTDWPPALRLPSLLASPL